MTRLASLLVVLALVVGCASTPTADGGSDGGDVTITAGAADASIATAKSQLEGLATRAVAFETENGRCIGAVTDVEQPAPNDPWGTPIAFMPASEAGPAAFVSAGPDATLLTDDDISARVTCMGG